MKRIDFTAPGGEGVLHLTVSGSTDEGILILACNVAYAAWKETKAGGGTCETLPEYITSCLRDAENICLIMAAFEDSI